MKKSVKLIVIISDEEEIMDILLNDSCSDWEPDSDSSSTTIKSNIGRPMNINNIIPNNA